MATAAERISLIIRSSVSDLISKFEDPAKLIDQAIIDEKNKYAKLLDESAQTFGQEKLAKRDYEDALKKADKEHELAAKALNAGNEGDAKQLLQLEQNYRRKAETLKITYDAVKKSADMIRASLNEAKDNIKQMEDKAAEIKAKAVATKAMNNATNINAGKKKIAVGNDFARLSAKADAEYNAALGKAEFVNAQNTKEEKIEAKYADNTGDDADDLLANLKAELGKK